MSHRQMGDKGNMTEKEAYIAFNLVEGIGAAKVAALAADCGGSIAAAYESLPDEANKDFRGGTPDWKGEIARTKKMHVEIVTPADPEYPERLRDLSSMPLALYVFGSVKALSLPSVAIVGTRRLSAYGAECADRFASGLAQAGWSVVSGLALGADAAAHSSALAAGGITVGILGGALDELFPDENRDLARRMAASGGAVATEFPFGRKPDKTTFPQRNRIVAALSSGVLALECPLKSGTMITCGFAADLGRPVMAVPGRIDAPFSAGCNALIRDGARLVTSADEVIAEILPLGGALGDRALPKLRAGKTAAKSGCGALGDRALPKLRAGKTAAKSGCGALGESALPNTMAGRKRASLVGLPPRGSRDANASPKPPPKPKREAVAPEVKLSLEEALVIKHVTDTPVGIDALVRKTGLTAARVNTVVVQLRMKRKIRLHPGNRVSRFV